MRDQLGMEGLTSPVEMEFSISNKGISLMMTVWHCIEQNAKTTVVKQKAWQEFLFSLSCCCSLVLLLKLGILKFKTCHQVIVHCKVNSMCLPGPDIALFHHLQEYCSGLGLTRVASRQQQI